LSIFFVIKALELTPNYRELNILALIGRNDHSCFRGVGVIIYNSKLHTKGFCDAMGDGRGFLFRLYQR